MAIPTFQDLMLPLLALAGDGECHTSKDAAEPLAQQFGLTAEEQVQVLARGQRVFLNRVHWARIYLVRARLLEAPSRGVFQITERGRAVLKSPPPVITTAFLKQFPEFSEWHGAATSIDSTTETSGDATATPEETIEAAFKQSRDALAAELLAQVKQASPTFFERLVVDLLVAMGYGGSRTDAGKALGRSGDGGIDGIIKEDKLGLDAIYLQAKRWTDRTVGRPDLQQFAGALNEKRARKGVFITTSTFAPGARDFVSRIDSKIILIDGEELASLMIDHNVGVTLERTYEIKRVDADFFTEE